MQVENLTFDFGETQDFDGEFKILKVCMQKQVIVILNPFFSFMFGFQLRKVHVGPYVGSSVQGIRVGYRLCW
jgi:hypothetical protein